MSKAARRLLDQFQPHTYSIELKPDWEAMTFSGSVTILGQKTGRPSQRLTFHQRGLMVTSAEVAKQDKKGAHVLTVGRINAHATYEEVRLHTKEMIYPGRYTVRMTFSGKISAATKANLIDIVTKTSGDEPLEPHVLKGTGARAVVPHIDEHDISPSLESVRRKS